MGTTLTLEALRILDMIDRKGSFAAATRTLDRVPSALTCIVRRLEDNRDLLLFDRRGRRAKLTPAGIQADRGPAPVAHFAWRNASRSKALKWFLQRLADPGIQAQLLQ